MTIQTHDQMARDVRKVARLRGIKLTRSQVEAAVQAHLRGKAYYDAILGVTKGKSVRDRKPKGGRWGHGSV